VFGFELEMAIIESLVRVVGIPTRTFCGRTCPAGYISDCWAEDAVPPKGKCQIRTLSIVNPFLWGICYSSVCEKSCVPIPFSNSV